MSLVRLIYASRVSSPLTSWQLRRLTQASAAKNSVIGITGTLLYCGGYFLQMLEGPDSPVRMLFNRISRDPRHFDVHELSVKAIVGRAFGDWGMSCFHEDLAQTLDHVKISKFTKQLVAASCPERLSEETSRLMIDLKGAIERQTASPAIPQAA